MCRPKIFKVTSVIAIILLIGTIHATASPASSQTPSGKIIYLAIDANDVENLWIADIAGQAEPEQVTPYTQPGIRLYNYQVTADGRRVIYQTFFENETHPGEILLLDLTTHQIEQITLCQEIETSNCYEFSIRPDGRFIAYFQSTRYMWLMRVIDLSVTPYADFVIHEFTSEKPLWYHRALPGWIDPTGYLTFNLPGSPYQFQVYDVEQRQPVQILPLGTPSRMPFFSPDGSRYAHYGSEVDITPRIIEIRETQNPTDPISAYAKLDMVSNGWEGGRIEDWYQDNERLLISTQWLRAPTEPNMVLLQSDLAVFNTTTGIIQLLTHDLDYSAFNASLNADASLIVYQRKSRMWTTPEPDCHQLMLYHTHSGEITDLGICGFVPRWLGE